MLSGYLIRSSDGQANHAQKRILSRDSNGAVSRRPHSIMQARILAIHAHPDDVEILAGGTLALLAAAGHTITIVTMTPGDCGSAELPADEIADIRRNEAGS